MGAVLHTKTVINQAARVGVDLESISNTFLEWKASEDKLHLFFGKDGAYYAPPVNGERILTHVHIMPHIDDFDDFEKWANEHLLRVTNKTSDRHIVYVYNEKTDDTLFLVFWNQNAHVLAGTPENPSELLCKIAFVAERWLRTGDIIA